MRAIKFIAPMLIVGACATPYHDPRAFWTRPDATLPVLADESTACFRASLDPDMPSAFPSPPSGPRLLPRTEPPPRLWERAPREAGFERFDEQLRYDRCMRLQGWTPARTNVPTL